MVRRNERDQLGRGIEGATAAVERLGGSVALPPFALRPGRRVAQVADPDGNMIELGQDG